MYKIKTFTKYSPLIEHTVKVNNLLMGQNDGNDGVFSKKIALNRHTYVDKLNSVISVTKNVRLLKKIYKN